MIPRICFSNSVKEKVATPISPKDLQVLMQSPSVQEICDKIVLLDGKDPEEMARLKQQLPVVYFHAQSFKDNLRKSANAVPSGLVMLDIDHVENPNDFLALEFLEKDAGNIREFLKENRIALIAKTPSNHGIRIVGEMQQGETIVQAQQRLANLFEVKQYDAVTKDLARASFVMPWSYVYYFDEDILQFAEQQSAQTPSGSPLKGEDKTPSNSETLSGSPLKGENKKSPFKGDLEGLSLPLREGQGGSEVDRTRKIALQLLELLGGQPTQGERNNIYYNLCRHLRTICAFSPDWLVRIVPDFGLSLEERCATAASAVNSTRTADKTALLRQAIEMVEKSEQETADIEDEPEIAQATTTLPPLPKVLEKICSRVPEPYRPALIMACLPILGTLATRVRFNYLDHQQQSFSFMSCIIAPPAAGKSFIRKPTNLLLTPINAQDEVERQKEQDYKDALRAAKNSKQQPENPRPCPRNNGVNISIAKLLQLLSYSDNKHLIGIAEELDTLTKSEKAGVWSQKRDIYRLAFDNAYYGQNYMSDNSFSANVPVYYNLLLTGTPNAAARFFKDVEDGLITRFCFAQLPDMFGQDIPNFEDYSEAEQRFIIGTATQLMDESGEVICAGVNQHIAKWVKQKGQEAVLEDSRAKDTLRKRAAVIGFRAGYLAYILNGRKYSKEIGQFAVWVAEYTFQNQMELFGSKFEEIMQGQIDEQGKRSHNKVLFEDLPSQFTLGELRQRRAERKLSVTRCAIAMLITRWIRKGLITETAKFEYKKL